ncbi:hypothetical protein [Nocardia jiangsuensis]|uniref:Outer membrane protein with glycine zipper n=1 Tax=Nocardia jiangsuensis TaxID=1691563 RepID=A0ABV8DS90_9NOCA
MVALGALPLVVALVGAGTANADPGSPDPVTQPEQRTAADPLAALFAGQPAEIALPELAAPLLDLTGPAPVAVPAGAPVDAPLYRAMPDQGYLAPAGAPHGPIPVEAVAPIAPPEGKIRIGDIIVDTPGFLAPDQVFAVNDGAAQAEAQLATFYDSIGMERSRSDKMAAQTLSSAAIGATVATNLSMPITSASVIVGAGAGLLAGVPFLPIGLLIGPILGGAIGGAVIAVPAAALGGAIGAAVGAGIGYGTPGFGAPVQ